MGSKQSATVATEWSTVYCKSGRHATLRTRIATRARRQERQAQHRAPAASRSWSLAAPGGNLRGPSCGGAAQGAAGQSLRSTRGRPCPTPTTGERRLN